MTCIYGAVEFFILYFSHLVTLTLRIRAVWVETTDAGTVWYCIRGWQVCICGAATIVRLFAGRSWTTVSVWSLCLCPLSTAWLNWSVTLRANSSSCSTQLDADRLYSRRLSTESPTSHQLIRIHLIQNRSRWIYCPCHNPRRAIINDG